MYNSFNFFADLHCMYYGHEFPTHIKHLVDYITQVTKYKFSVPVLTGM